MSALCGLHTTEEIQRGPVRLRLCIIAERPRIAPLQIVVLCLTKVIAERKTGTALKSDMLCNENAPKTQYLSYVALGAC